MNSAKRRLKLALRRWLSGAAETLGCPMDPGELSAPAIVFSPHPDDETLGCGGTILRKRKAGAPVTVVFMTDGSASHRRFLSGEELKCRRSGEALAACAALGVEPDRVLFLEFADGRLKEFHEAAVRKVSEILSRHDGARIFVPYAGDTTSDHKATRAIVLAALRKTGKRAVVYEYPVWFWHHWPWVSPPPAGRMQAAIELRDAMLSWLRLIKDLRCFVPTAEVIEQKRAALNCHRTQMTRVVPDAGWFTLSDVAGGEFLECFFKKRELFYRYRVQ